MACSIQVSEYADTVSGIEQYAIRAFADALEDIPLALAENSGLDPITSVSDMRIRQINEKNPSIGVDCMNTGDADMKHQHVIETLISKQQQFLLVCSHRRTHSLGHSTLPYDSQD